MDAIFYWIGISACIALAIAAIGGLFFLAGTIFLHAGDYLLQKGLRLVRITNWRYWNDRMQAEGLTVMDTYYQELVTQRQPKSPRDWENAENDAQKGQP